MASLRRRWNCSSSARRTGSLSFTPARSMVLALQLLSQIPGFIVRRVVNLHEMCSALQGDPTLAGHELASNVRCRQEGYAVDGPVPRYQDNQVGNPVLCDPSHWVNRGGHLVRVHVCFCQKCVCGSSCFLFRLYCVISVTFSLQFWCVG